MTRPLALVGAFTILLQLSNLVHGAHLAANDRPLPACAGVGAAYAWALFGGGE
jgi:hypothetical protein